MEGISINERSQERHVSKTIQISRVVKIKFLLTTSSCQENNKWGEYKKIVTVIRLHSGHTQSSEWSYLKGLFHLHPPLTSSRQVSTDTYFNLENSPKKIRALTG